MPTIILKDETGKPVTDSLTGLPVSAEVSEDVAAFLKENDAYLVRLEHIDTRHFELVHYDKPAWDNLSDLSLPFSSEDVCLGVPIEIAVAERELYHRRLIRCRIARRMLRKACTPTQWRRFLLHRYYGFTSRQIARMEGRSHPSVNESIWGAEKKIKKIFSELP